MNNVVNFKSSLADYMNQYLEDYSARGLKIENLMKAIKPFDRYLYAINYDKDYVTEKVFWGWSDTLVNIAAKTKYQALLKICQFSRYLTMIGNPSYIPNRIQYAKSYYTPYIYTPEELQRIFLYADQWRSRSYPRCSVAFIMPALLRLLYSTGMRIGEALKLQNMDIDFEKKMIFLRHTKNCHERICPINDTLHQVLKQYLKYRDLFPLEKVRDPEATLFVNLAGEPCKEKSVERLFREFMDEIGFIQRRPRIHDFRHTACVHAMKNLLDKGYDIYNILPRLRAFMGHLEISSTEYYVRLTQDAYPGIFDAECSQKEELNNIIRMAVYYEEK